MSRSGAQEQEQQQQQQLLDSRIKSRNEEEVASIPEQVDWALHAKPGPSAAALANELSPVNSYQEQVATSAPAEQPVGLEHDQELDSRWGRMLRTMTRCLVYCTERLAAGFGLSRQQTAWYKHCWDNPSPHPRGITILGATDRFIAPHSMMAEAAEENTI
ncbi:uncharacterized protein LOC135440045 [Drosophila montana]|uniref:uncharacterized protein LOC135440045 n=1 Tax=Drosophila montana TaxID=40370 RepID=UPI00313BB901